MQRHFFGRFVGFNPTFSFSTNLMNYKTMKLRKMNLRIFTDRLRIRRKQNEMKVVK